MYVLESVSILKDALGFYQSFLRKLSIKGAARARCGGGPFCLHKLHIKSLAQILKADTIRLKKPSQQCRDFNINEFNLTSI